KVFVEVAQARSIHRIPHQSGSLILGVVNVSGAVRLCFSLAHLLGVNTDGAQQPSPLHGVYQRYLAIKVNDAGYVFPVDEVGGVYRYDPQDLKQVPVTVEPRKAELLLGVLDIKGNNVACIDAARLGQVFEGMSGE
ncbi:MAG: chemotaxis protein CheW, partial [Gammaproteobacteria bacterium]